eukprot:8703740-Pyramimonas_sp.AAC.2
MVDVKGYRVDAKGYMVDVKGYSVDANVHPRVTVAHAGAPVRVRRCACARGTDFFKQSAHTNTPDCAHAAHMTLVYEKTRALCIILLLHYTGPPVPMTARKARRAHTHGRGVCRWCERSRRSFAGRGLPGAVGKSESRAPHTHASVIQGIADMLLESPVRNALHEL